MEIEQSIRCIEVTALRMPKPVLLDQATPIRRVVERMREQRTGVALLTSEGNPPRLAGIFTERDVMMKVLGREKLLDSPASELMTPDPTVIEEGDCIELALEIMNRDGIRHVPVRARDGRVIACVRHKDIIRYLVEHFAERLLNLPPNPDQVAVSREGG